MLTDEEVKEIIDNVLVEARIAKKFTTSDLCGWVELFSGGLFTAKLIAELVKMIWREQESVNIVNHGDYYTFVGQDEPTQRDNSGPA